MSWNNTMSLRPFLKVINGFLSIIMISYLAACSPFTAGDDNSNGAEGESNNEEVVIWHWETPPHRVEAFEKLGERFTEETGINIKQVPINNPDYNNKIISAAGTESMPDIVFANPPQMTLLRSRDLVIPVDDIFQELNEQVNYYDPYKIYNQDGNQWGIPLFAVTWPLLYREDLHVEAGFEGPPKDWEDLLKRAEEMHTSDVPGFYLPVSTNGNYSNQVIWGFLRSNGAQIVEGGENGEKVVFNSPETIETYEFLKTLSQFNGKGVQNADWGSTELLVRNGEVNTLVYNGAPIGEMAKEGGNEELAKKYAMSLIPTPDSSMTSRNTGYVRAAMITKAAEERGNTDAAKEWLRWISEPENHAELLLAHVGLFMPVDQATSESEKWKTNEFNQKYEEMINVMVESVSHISTQGFVDGHSSPHAASIEGSRLTAQVLQKIVLEDVPVEEAVAWGHQEYEKLISE